MSPRADCGPSLHLRGLWANLEEAAVHMAVELKNAAFDLMAAESPNLLSYKPQAVHFLGDQKRAYVN
jgi:alpha-D-ribose 1-methylphosphonate 5-triphosphate synthase subunit PhnL